MLYIDKSMFYVYVLISGSDHNFYVGYSHDLRRRIMEHSRDGVSSTRKREDLRFIFYEAFISKHDAQRRERYLKSTKGRSTLRLMLRESMK
jgi:putative endonuclease